MEIDLIQFAWGVMFGLWGILFIFYIIPYVISRAKGEYQAEQSRRDRKEKFEEKWGREDPESITAVEYTNVHGQWVLSNVERR